MLLFAMNEPLSRLEPVRTSSNHQSAVLPKSEIARVNPIKPVICPAGWAGWEVGRQDWGANMQTSGQEGQKFTSLYSSNNSGRVSRGRLSLGLTDGLISNSAELKKQRKVYSRSQLLQYVKDLLDVLCGLLPHVIGLLATHVCRRLSSNFSSQSCRDKDEEERCQQHQSWQWSQCTNPGSSSRLLHHHNHQDLQDYWAAMRKHASAVLLRLSADNNPWDVKVEAPGRVRRSRQTEK